MIEVNFVEIGIGFAHHRPGFATIIGAHDILIGSRIQNGRIVARGVYQHVPNQLPRGVEGAVRAPQGTVDGLPRIARIFRYQQAISVIIGSRRSGRLSVGLTGSRIPILLVSLAAVLHQARNTAYFPCLLGGPPRASAVGSQPHST